MVFQINQVMFVGHYAAALVLKGKERNSSLGMLFIATQWVDILFFPFVLAGIEKLEFVEGFTAVNDFNMYFYPYTHGLVGSLFWSLLAFVVYFILLKGKPHQIGVAVAMALGVLSHWFADLLVHTADLPLLSGEPKFGLGIWHNKEATFALEAVLVIASAYYYVAKTKLKKPSGSWAIWAFVFFLLLVNFLNLYILPPNHDMVGLTISALLSYFIFAGIAHWADKKRS